jgi:hypothetical protein
MISLHINCLQVCQCGPATRNRTWIDSLEGYCIIHYTMASKPRKAPFQILEPAQDPCIQSYLEY